jgi:AraC-like DNA-binding protein
MGALRVIGPSAELKSQPVGQSTRARLQKACVVDYLSSFSLIDVVQFMTAGFAVLLALPMMLSANRDQPRLFLAAFLLLQGGFAIWSVITWSPVLSAVTRELLNPFEHVPSIVLQGLQGPLLLWYSYSVSGRPVRPTRFDKTIIAVFVLLPAPIAWLTSSHGIWSYVVFGILAGLISILYGIRALRQVIDHNREIRQRYSSIEQRQLLWLGYLSFGFIGVWSMRITAGVVGIFNVGLAMMIGGLSIYPVAILICWMAVLGMGRGVRADNDYGANALHPSPNSAPKPFNPELTEKLKDLMSRVKLYQDPDLHLDGLADTMGISSRSLSALINGHYEQNFYDYVNDYRVRDAQRQLEDPGLKSKTIQRVMEDAGFNSKSTFNSHFKKVTGKTPSEYRKAAHSQFDVNLGGSAQ